MYLGVGGGGYEFGSLSSHDADKMDFLDAFLPQNYFIFLLGQHRVWYQIVARNFPIKQYYILLDLPLLTEMLGRRNKCPYISASVSFKAIVHFIGNCLPLTWISTRQRSNNDNWYIYFSFESRYYTSERKMKQLFHCSFCVVAQIVS